MQETEYSAQNKGNTAQRSHDGFALNPLAFFPSSFTKIP